MVSLNVHIFKMFSFLHQNILGSYHVVQSLELQIPDNSNDVSTAYILPTSLLIASHIPTQNYCNILKPVACFIPKALVYTSLTSGNALPQVGTYFPWAPCFV